MAAPEALDVDPRSPHGHPDVRGVAPDLIAYLGDLRWRSVASVGGAGKWFTTDNDTGPDDVNHAEHGVFALSGGTLGVGRRPDLSLYEISPMLRRLLGVG